MYICQLTTTRRLAEPSNIVPQTRPEQRTSPTRQSSICHVLYAACQREVPDLATLRPLGNSLGLEKKVNKKGGKGEEGCEAINVLLRTRVNLML